MATSLATSASTAVASNIVAAASDRLYIASTQPTPNLISIAQSIIAVASINQTSSAADEYQGQVRAVPALPCMREYQVMRCGWLKLVSC